MTLIDARALVRTIFLALVLSSPLHAPAAAGEHDQLDRGPKVGAPIPHSLGALDQHDQHQDFKSLARRRGLIILFSRSLDW
jgi:hypothetical protein